MLQNWVVTPFWKGSICICVYGTIHTPMAYICIYAHTCMNGPICIYASMHICVWMVPYAYMCMHTCACRRDSFICETCSVHTWDMTHPYVRHDLLIYETWLIHMRDMPDLYVYHDSFIYMWGATPSYVYAHMCRSMCWSHVCVRM